MTYTHWLENHSQKHKDIVDKLTHLSDEEIIEYFDFDNMVQKEPLFCLLYKENKKCHEMEKLNCYMCGCPLFRVTNNKSYCKINSRFGGMFSKQSFSEGISGVSRQLQSYTILIGVVAESFFTGWCGI